MQALKHGLMSKAEQKRELKAWAGMAPGQRVSRKEMKMLLEAKLSNQTVLLDESWNDEDFD